MEAYRALHASLLRHGMMIAETSQVSFARNVDGRMFCSMVQGIWFPSRNPKQYVLITLQSFSRSNHRCKGVHVCTGVRLREQPDRACRVIIIIGGGRRGPSSGSGCSTRPKGSLRGQSDNQFDLRLPFSHHRGMGQFHGCADIAAGFESYGK